MSNSVTKKHFQMNYLVIWVYFQASWLQEQPKNVKSIKPAEKSIAKWCRATGMKENATKREGIAMGKLRNKQMPGPTKWIKTGDSAKSLGYPIGNKLSHEAFWNKKLEAKKLAEIASKQPKN